MIALSLAREDDHVLCWCQRLKMEYFNVIWEKLPQARISGFTLLWNQKLPPRRLQLDDPAHEVPFGPKEDRWHMQLAVDARAMFHVTNDTAILAWATQMKERGVLECNPWQYLAACRPGS